MVQILHRGVEGEIDGKMEKNEVMTSFRDIIILFVWVVGSTGSTLAQSPVFEDLLIDNSKIAGQNGSGIFSLNGYTLTRSGGTDNIGNDRSVDYVWYDLPGVCADGSGTVEVDITGLFPNEGCSKNELLVMCDSMGLSPATNGADYYSSPCRFIMRKDNYTPCTNVNKMKMAAGVSGGNEFEARTNVLPWNGASTYRFRVTWSGYTMRVYRGLPGQTLTLLDPPTPYGFGIAWSPSILHIQVGSTFRVLRTRDSGGAPGTIYKCLRVYEENIGDVATPCSSSEVVSIDMGSPDVWQGILHPQFDGGHTTPAVIGGRSCRKNSDPNGSPQDVYFYFNVNDCWSYQGNKPNVYIMIDYYDTGTGSLELQYDSISGIYTTGGSVALTGTDTWKQYAFYVTNAYFGNRQNDGADFRICSQPGNTFYLDVAGASEETFLPDKATGPIPANQATWVRWDADLSWSAAEGAVSYEVYFGTVNPPVFQGSQNETTYHPGTMSALTPYYWRIDTVNGFGTTQGDVWSFTTGSYRGDFDEDLDIDQEDFGFFQACMSGSGRPCPVECEKANFDGDIDVDLEDFNVFQACMGGANQLPPSGCSG